MNEIWEEDQNGDWTLRIGDVKVRYLTNTQKESLEKIFSEIGSFEDKNTGFNDR